MPMFRRHKWAEDGIIGPPFAENVRMNPGPLETDAGWHPNAALAVWNLAQGGDLPPAAGEWALALYLASTEVPADFEHHGKRLLHVTIKALGAPDRPRPQAPPIYPVSAEERWPELSAADSIPPRERLAACLIARGADPWLKDADGLDALDHAVTTGATGLVAQLLRHAACPPLAALWARTTAVEQRSLPWVHAAVNRSDWWFLDLLVKAGAPADARDSLGNLPAAWVRREADMVALAKRGLLPDDSDERSKVQQFWSRRVALRLTPTRPINPKLLQEAWEKAAPGSPETTQTVQWVAAIEKWLAIKPDKKMQYSTPPDLASSAAERTQQGEASRGFRHTGARGSSKGTWDLPSAWLMALTCYRSDKVKPDFVFDQLNSWMAAWSTDEIRTWLDQPLREDLTPRGLLGLLVLGRMRLPARPAERTMGYRAPSTPPPPTAPEEDCRVRTLAVCDPDRVLRAAVDATLALTSAKNTAHQRILEVGYLWDDTIKHYRYSDPIGTGNDWARLLDGFPGSLNEESLDAFHQWTTRHAHRQPGNAEEARNTFALTKALISFTGLRVSHRGLHGNQERVVAEHRKKRAELFLKASAWHAQDPSIGTWFSALPFTQAFDESLCKNENALWGLVHTEWLARNVPESPVSRTKRARL